MCDDIITIMLRVHAIQTKQDDFNDALAAMAPAIVSNDSDDDEWD